MLKTFKILTQIILSLLILTCADTSPVSENKKIITDRQKQQINIENRSELDNILLERIRETSFILNNGLKLSTADWTPRGGIWDFSDSIYYGQGTQINNKAYYNKTDFGDFIFEVKMTKLTEDGSFGLLFRYNEHTDNGYILEIYPHGGFVFGTYYLGVREVLINEPIKKFKRAVNAWNKVKVLAKGNAFSVFINDYLITSLKNNRYSTGRIGFYIGGGPRQQARFRVMQIKEFK
ncbi:MAG TPA: DUF1080 domain-containing protein [Caldithrix abyssi]|uniref:DUF1080 domain-containing protein n=1 Tax=Caldithrix abyssi TaxID=187145 RepID=A0A7V4U0A7_CALAY|nr:DUF1080 domain-containing protein [Caldithrix abyssi]